MSTTGTCCPSVSLYEAVKVKRLFQGSLHFLSPLHRSFFVRLEVDLVVAAKCDSRERRPPGRRRHALVHRHAEHLAVPVEHGVEIGRGDPDVLQGRMGDDLCVHFFLSALLLRRYPRADERSKRHSSVRHHGQWAITAYKATY